MFFIYLEARARFSHREDFRIIDTCEVLESQKQVLALYKIPLKVNVLWFIFSNVEGLHLQSLFRNKHLLRYIFKTPILRAPFSQKNMWCLLK